MKSLHRRHKHKVRHSIKGRLMIAFVALAAASTAVFSFGMQQWLHAGWDNWVRPLVADYADRMAAELGNPPEPARAAALAARLPITVRIDGPAVQYASDPARSPRGPWRIVRQSADGHRITFGLAQPPDAMRPRMIGWATLAALLLLTMLAWAMVRRQLAPLAAIGAGVEAYGRGEFEQPIPVKRRDELGLLTERINGMAVKLNGMLQSQRALLLAISHELRSPLTRARVNAELVDDGTPRQALLRDLAEMGDLITSLLESERLAQGHAALLTEAVDLAALARELVATQFEGQAVHFELDKSIGPVRADRDRLRLLLRNLLANALHHGAAAEPPTLFLRREAEGRIALGVRDHGAGVAPGQLERLGEAFWRPDDARTRGAGGVGLGLFLCRRVAQAHGGELRLRDAAPGLEACAVWTPESALVTPPAASA